MNSRILHLQIALLMACGLFGGCQWSRNPAAANPKKVLILGIDAMDPAILERLMEDGKLPNFQRLRKSGDFKRIATSIPPESPVAWSNFITGQNPGGHGIFDFIHRDPATMIPYLSTSRTEAGGRSLRLGEWVLPLSSGKVTLLRHGKSFWEVLNHSGVPTTVIRIPANFPPASAAGIQLSGMGTPDIQGTYGTFSFYTDESIEKFSGVTGGDFIGVRLEEGCIQAKLFGPNNSFKRGAPRCEVDFIVYVDAQNPVAKISLQSQQILLQEKQWSEWVRIKFELIPYLQSVSGICRFYLQEVHPHFKLYVSPVNLDPSAPAMPISEPGGYSAELAEHIGLYHTQGIPEDTKALSGGILEDGEFLQQAKTVLDEEMRMFDYELNRFHAGLFYFYFGTIDQLQHMFWRAMDPQHPAHDPATSYGRVIEDAYREMDVVLGKALSRLDEHTTLIVVSDHGFAPFYRAFSLNTWLKNNAYASLLDFSEGDMLQNVDWANTRAYGLGFSGLYVNLKGRERNGIVEPGRPREELLKELTEKLLALRDPKNGEPIILRIYRTDQAYAGPYVKEAPDLIIGYNRGYRASSESTLGKFPRELLKDNLDKWSGDHLMAPEVVPGVFMSNKKIKSEHPALLDIAPSILAEFGIPAEREMVGSNVF